MQGAQVWDLCLRIQNQLRTDFGHVLGWDFTAAFRMGDALGIEPAAVAEFLPHIEIELINGRAALREAEDRQTANDTDH